MGWSPSQVLERGVIRLFARGQALQEELDHLRSVRSMCPTGDSWSPVQYLYDRLNIIDAKASSILTVNTISLGISSVVLASAGSADSAQVAFVADQPPLLFWLALSAILFSMLALLLTLAMTRLEFDHITPAHPFEQYLNNFLEITIARQRILAAARLLTGSAFVLFAVIILWTLVRARGW